MDHKVEPRHVFARMAADEIDTDMSDRFEEMWDSLDPEIRAEILLGWEKIVRVAINRALARSTDSASTDEQR